MQFIAATDDVDTYVRLTKDYVEELQQYDETALWQERIVMSWISSSYLVRVCNRIVGFFSLDTIQSEKYGIVYGIAEFYVVPEFRRANIGTFILEEIMGLIGSCLVFIHILKKNKNALAFWKYAFANIRALELQDDFLFGEIGCPDNCVLKIFRFDSAEQGGVDYVCKEKSYVGVL